MRPFAVGQGPATIDGINTSVTCTLDLRYYAYLFVFDNAKKYACCFSNARQCQLTHHSPSQALFPLLSQHITCAFDRATNLSLGLRILHFVPRIRQIPSKIPIRLILFRLRIARLISRLYNEEAPNLRLWDDPSPPLPRPCLTP